MGSSELLKIAGACLLGILVSGEIARAVLLPWQAYVALGAALALALARRPQTAAWALAAAFACVGAACATAEEISNRDVRAQVRAAALGGEDRRLEGQIRAIERREDDAVFYALELDEGPIDLDLRVSAEEGAEVDLLPGDRVAVTGQVRPAERYRLPGRPGRRGGSDGSIATSTDKVEIVAEGTSWHPRRLAARAQNRTVQWVLAREGPKEGLAVLRAALTGDRGGMPHEVREALRDAGAAHVLAVSGLHLAAVAGLTFLATRRLVAAISPLAVRARPARVGAAVAAPVAIAYTLVTGAQTSTVRALVMALAALAGAALDRRPRGPEALALAALAVALTSPGAVYEPAFQLSFAAAGSLVFFARRARGRGLIGRGVAGLRSLIRASVLTGAATAPFTALAFGHVAIAGVVTNLVAVPLTSSAVLPLGLAGAALALVWPAAGAAVAEGAARVAAWVVESSAAVADLIPPLSVPPPTAFELAAAAAFACALYALRGGGGRLRFGVGLALFAGVLVTFSLMPVGKTRAVFGKEAG